MVARLGDEVLVERCENGAARLVGVGAVGESAVVGVVENLTEVGGELFGFDVECAEPFDARGVDEVAVVVEGNHLAERGGVHAGVVGIADGGGAQVGAWYKVIDECGFAYAAVAREGIDFPSQERFELVHAFAGGGREGYGRVADLPVEREHHFLKVQLVGAEQVGLVEHEHHGYAVGFG